MKQIELTDDERAKISNVLADILKGYGVEMLDNETENKLDGMAHDSFYEEIILDVQEYCGFVLERLKVKK